MCLALRSHVEVPIVAIAGTDRPAGVVEMSHARSSTPLLVSERFAADRAADREPPQPGSTQSVNLTEPFARIREPWPKPRKAGASRAA